MARWQCPFVGSLALRVIEQRWTVTAAAQAANASRQTASKWAGRFRTEGSSVEWTARRDLTGSGGGLNGARPIDRVRQDVVGRYT